MDPIEQAVRILRRGGLVAFPTETVYGLGADALNPAAVRRVFAAKGRPAGHPVIVHLPDTDALDGWAAHTPRQARVLAARFWPGPLTIILHRAPRVPDAVTGGLDTVGLRVPSHPVARDLLRAFGSGLAAPSANRFGSVSATRAEHVVQDLGDAVDLVLDGGACTVGVESTIVDLSSGSPALLRPGGVARELVEEALGIAVAVREPGRVRAPGTLPSHYAPRARVVLTSASERAATVEALRAQGGVVGVLGEGRAGLPEDVQLIDLPIDPAAAAAGLYDAFREADRRGCDVVVAVPPAQAGLGAAVADRLQRAAGPREPGDDLP